MVALMARPPRVVHRRPYDLIREGRTVLFGDEPARVVAVYWSTPHPLNAPQVIAADLYLPGPGVELSWVEPDRITELDPIAVSAAGIRGALAEHNPELIPLIGKITSSRRVTHVWPDRSAAYEVALSPFGAALRLETALAWCWSDSSGVPTMTANTKRVVITNSHDPDLVTVMIWRARWADTTPVPAWRMAATS